MRPCSWEPLELEVETQRPLPPSSPDFSPPFPPPPRTKHKQRPEAAPGFLGLVFTLLEDTQRKRNLDCLPASLPSDSSLAPELLRYLLIRVNSPPGAVFPLAFLRNIQLFPGYQQP